MLFQPISERDNLCQGDILEIRDGPQGSHLGVVVTADCDIAQSKFGRYLTYLPIVPVEVFLREIWAPSKLRDVQKKASELAVEMIWPIEKLRDSQVDRMKESELIYWLGKDSAESIAECFPATKDKHDRLLHHLVIASHSTGPFTNALLSLFTIWKLQQATEQQIRSNIRSAITQIRSDFFFLPTMPDKSDVGYVALLRDVQSICSDNTFRSHFEFAAADPQERYAIRIGRFSDNIKYGVVQRFANLFSRIGFEERFEDECSISVDIIIDSIIDRREGDA